MKTFKEVRSIIREFSDSQIDMLAKQYAGLKDKTISIDQANKLRKIFDRIPDRALDALRKKKIPFISGLALSRMVKKGMPVRESVTSDDDYKAKKKELQDIQTDPKRYAVVGRDMLVKRKDKLDKEYQNYKSKTNIAASVDKAIDKAIEEDAPTNAVGDGSNLAMPPDAEPGVHVKKKKKDLTSLLRREDYDKVELENLINKIESNQDIENNQIKPIVNNIKSKKQKGTYSEEFGMTAFRYVVDGQINSTVSEEIRNTVASELLSKYV